MRNCRHLFSLLLHGLCFLLLLGAPSLTAQKITVSEEVGIKTDFSYTVIGKFADRVLLFRDQSSRYEVQAFDENMRVVWTRELNFNRQRPDIIGINKYKDLWHLFFGFREKGDYHIMHYAYNAKADLVDSTTIGVIERQYFSPRFRFTESEDHSKVLLFKSDKETELDAFSYDLSSMNLLWYKLLDLKNTFLRRDFRRMIVTDKGDMLMFLEHNKTFSADVEYELIHVSSATHNVEHLAFNFGELVIQDFYPVYDNYNTRIAFAGMYSLKNTAKADGMFYAILNPGSSGPEVYLHSFKEEIVEDVHGKDVDPEKGLTNFMVSDIVLRQDGGAIIIAELSKEYSRRNSMPMRQDYASYSASSWVDYYYEDLVVFSVHPEGEHHWSFVLHKKQHSQDDDAMFSSYFLFKTPQKIRLLYNDEIRNENNVSEYVIRGNGYYERNSVFSTDYHRLRLRFRDAIQVGYNECIVPSERNNRLNLVRIMF